MFGLNIEHEKTLFDINREPVLSPNDKVYIIVELLMSQKTLPWPLFVNQGFYIPKCLLSCVDFKNGSCHFFFSLSRSRSKVKGHGFRIYGITYYVTGFGSFSVKEVPNLVLSKVDTLRQLLMQFLNDLDLPTRKVKVI